ncbi:nickel pincer cofactor biosynthesis protein LarC [Rubripirellula sp.]|jgi:pyridinium-3,5-bisthiocarboxylic acid mononucleotide nickel chelatase|nr:nickel pincer cofactor biosynthesis protein LarC [Rubripirellula sp.]MDB4749448.1 nickel pincer cofactor biosynthesis protein LarC [Rubripirellula sp.]
MGQIAYFDCISGISGDMTLGALVDLGADVAVIESAVRSMGLPDLTIRSETVKKRGFRAISVHIEHPPEHAHRHLHHITEMIDRATEVTPAAKETAHRIFQKVAEAEAKVHGSTLEKVHFHEVGAIDSIADIVGTAVAMDSLGIETISSSPIPTGTGEITIAHGRVSIPAPATAELLRGIPIAGSDIQAELTTPTGAAILKACATSFGPLPSMTMKAVGYGAGSMDLEAQANVLRVILGESEDAPVSRASQIESDRVVILESNIDDSTPEQLADCATRLMSAGALDVSQTPCTMKKGRSGVILTAMTTSNRATLLETIIFEHSTAIGIRRYHADRHKLRRKATVVDTEYGPVRGKVIELPSGKLRFTIEDDDATNIATSNQTTATEIRRAATTAYGNAKQSQ